VKILVIGGTRFLGPHFVRAALVRDHDVTVFNRGTRRLPEMPGFRQVHGDRRRDLGALNGESFDAVVDTCAYHPDDIASSAVELSRTCARYCLISSVSVYAGDAGCLDENAAVVEAPVPVPEAMTPEHYGALKAMCEREARCAFGAELLVVRPGLIAGPDDPTHRFGYWVRRIARGGDVVVPEPQSAPVEFIDVRDLAAWLLVALEKGLSGTYNADGPSRRTTMSEFMEACVASLRSDARLHWVDGKRLLDFGVEPWVELPLWIPPTEQGFLTFDSSKARSDGLACRPVSATIAAARAWDREHGPADNAVRTLTPEKESAILSGIGAAIG
jgi:2'-hydroxyisoflavone reductase